MNAYENGVELFKGLKKFKSSTDRATEGILIYGGSETKVQNGVQISNPGSMNELLDAFLKIGIVQ